MAKKLIPNSSYGMMTEREIIIPKTIVKVPLSKLVSLKPKIKPQSKVEVEINPT